MLGMHEAAANHFKIAYEFKRMLYNLEKINDEEIKYKII